MGTISELLIWSFMVLQMVIIFMLARLIGSYITKVNQLEANFGNSLNMSTLTEGQAAPSFRDFNQNGVAVSLPAEGAILLFITPGCNNCDNIATYLRDLSTSEKIFVISDGKVEGNTTASSNIHFLNSSIITKNYNVKEFPTLVHVGVDRKIIDVRFQTNVEEVKTIIKSEKDKVS